MRSAVKKSGGAFSLTVNDAKSILWLFESTAEVSREKTYNLDYLGVGGNKWGVCKFS